MSETEKILTPETPALPTPETSAETVARPETPRLEAQQPAQPVAAAPAATPVEPAQTLTAEAQQAADIERVLEADLSEMYFSLPEDKKAEFRAKGEETAREINVLVSSAKATLQKVVSLIRGWLLIIPGINKFFLEQEAKIKADEILRIANRR